jgi:hypothetical protein
VSRPKSWALTAVAGAATRQMAVPTVAHARPRVRFMAELYGLAGGSGGLRANFVSRAFSTDRGKPGHAPPGPRSTLSIGRPLASSSTSLSR